MQQDVFEVINKGWDMMIAFPPCTDLSVAGAWAMYKKDENGKQSYKRG
jgi:site-specific DNA-cytosine methylase